MIVYELAENTHRKGLFMTEEAAKRRAQEILDGYEPLRVDEETAKARCLEEGKDPEAELLLMEEFTTLPLHPLEWRTEQHYLHERSPRKGPPVGPPVPTAWFTNKSCFTIHERKVHE